MRNFSAGQNNQNFNLSLILVISSRVAGRNLAHSGKDFSLSLEMTNYHEVCPVDNAKHPVGQTFDQNREILDSVFGYFAFCLAIKAMYKATDPATAAFSEWI